MLVLLLGLLAAADPAQPASSDPCAHDRAALLALPPDKFDQDPGGGWRELESKLDRCASVAADLLADYRKAHWGTFTPQELHINYWHEGQLRAIAGDTERALRLLAAGVHPGAEDPIDFLDYAVGTIAFLQRDLPALKSARKRLGKLPAPPDWAAQQADMKARFGMVMAWPPNSDVLDGLIACFDKPYAKAYVECRPRAKTGK